MLQRYIPSFRELVTIQPEGVNELKLKKLATTTAILATFSCTPFIPVFAGTSQAYIVQSSDTMYKIAASHSVTLSALEAANPQIHNTAAIYPGEIINIPAVSSSASNVSTRSYTIQPGDTLYKISLAQNVSLLSIEALNPNINVNNLMIGEIINLPVVKTSSTSNTATGSNNSTASSFSSMSTNSNSTKVDAIINTAKSFLGVRYTWGGNKPSTGFDCSGFVQYVFSQNGITLPRESHDQATVGTPVSKDSLQPGDLLFFTYTDSSASLYANHVTHVGIFIGNGSMIESSSSHNNEGVVIVQNVFSNPYYIAHYYGARNVIS